MTAKTILTIVIIIFVGYLSFVIYKKNLIKKAAVSSGLLFEQLGKMSVTELKKLL